MTDNTTKTNFCFDAEKSRVLDWIVVNIEETQGEDREFWRFIKRVWEDHIFDEIDGG